MKFVEAAGVKTHIQTWGAGDSVLLIHGASSHIGTWEPTIVPMLKDRYLVAAYDRPGMGYTTDRPQGSDTLALQANVAAGVIEQLGLKKPVIVAHSWGGAVALRLALDRPDLVGGLVLIAPVAYEWPGGVDWYNYWSANPVSGWLFNNVIAQPFAGASVKSGMAGRASGGARAVGHGDRGRGGAVVGRERHGRERNDGRRDVAGRLQRRLDLDLGVEQARARARDRGQPRHPGH